MIPGESLELQGLSTQLPGGQLLLEPRPTSGSPPAHPPNMSQAGRGSSSSCAPRGPVDVPCSALLSQPGPPSSRGVPHRSPPGAAAAWEPPAPPPNAAEELKSRGTQFCRRALTPRGAGWACSEPAVSRSLLTSESAARGSSHGRDPWEPAQPSPSPHLGLPRLAEAHLPAGLGPTASLPCSGPDQDPPWKAGPGWASGQGLCTGAGG